MYYFKFLIPTNADGSTVSYSPGWCGTRPKCAEKGKGLLYNDAERWGIGQADGDFVPDDVEVLDEKQVQQLFSQAINQLTDGENWKSIFFAGDFLPKDKEYSCNTIEHRWDDAVKELEVKQQDTQFPTVNRVVFCPVCHRFILWLPLTIKAATINLTCPVGHKVVLNGK